MENVKTFMQKWIAIMTILVMVLGQYAITGFLSTSYAIDLLATQSENVQFRAYFKNGDEELTEIQSSIDSNNLKLKIDVAVKNQGYFNGQISFVNAGFKLSENTTNTYINRIENNIIYLNQINAEDTVSIEVEIDYFKDEKIQASTLNQTTTVKLTGIYTSSAGNMNIDGGSDVKIIWTIPENIKAELAAKVQTNSIYKVNEENKKIVQFLTSGKLTNNAYPVKNTQVTATIPIGATNVKVSKRTTKATNGEQEFTTANYNVENNILTINIANTEIDGKISWAKGTNDIFVVTYEYPEGTDLSAQTITINEKITAQNNVELNAQQVQLTLSEQRDGIASISKQERETSIYKGKIYSQEGRDITSYSIVYVDYVDGVKDIEITEQTPKFIKEIENNGETTTQESNANSYIKSIKVNKTKVENILGNTWVLTIGETTVTNETQADQNGDIIINLNEGTQNLTIKTSKPVNNGAFIIETTKKILGTNYTRTQLKEFTKLKDGASIKYTKNNNDTFTFTSWNNINLKETESKASLQVEQTALIAGSNTQALNLTAVLESSGEHQDLYKNPHIKIKLPSQVQNVTYTQIPQLMYANGLELTEGNYKIVEENGQKVIDITLTGEQASYLGEAVQGTTLLIKTNVQIDQTAITSNEEIIMTYTNENATKYTDNGTEKVNTQIVATPTQGESSETGNQGSNTGNQSGSQESGTEGSSEQPNTQGENLQNQTQGTIGQLKYNVFARVGGETISEGDTVKAGEIIEYTIKLENPTTEDIEDINISATVPENTTLIEVNSKYPYYNEEKHAYTTDEPYFIEKSDRNINKNGLTVNAKKSIEIKYMVKVNSNLDSTKNIEATQNINYSNYNANTSIKNKIEPGALEAKFNLAYKKKEDELNYGYEYIYQLYITNNTSEEQKNVQVNINMNDLMEKKYIEYSSDGPREQVEGDGLSFTIDSIKANDIAYVEYGIKIKEFTNVLDKAEAVCIVKDSNNNQYRSNKLSNEVSGIKVNLNLTAKVESKSSTNTLNLGDEITYTISLKNIGKTDSNELVINDKFSKYLELQSVLLNGTKCEYTQNDEYDEQKNYNILKINSSLKVGEEAYITIKGKVKEDLTLAQDLEIVNQVDLYDDILIESSEKITYYLKSTSQSNGSGNEQNENQNNENGQNNGNSSKGNNNGDNNVAELNTISGIAWLDANEDGKRDSEEELLGNISVTLMDLNSNKSKNAITNNNGEYKFENVENGKYIVMFEYDMKKYMVTVYKADGVDSNQNSDVQIVQVKKDGKKMKVAATDTLTISNSGLTNIDIGLIQANIFDLSLVKQVSRITISNSNGTTTKEYDDSNLAKVEIKSKYLKSTTVLIEYSIRVTNNGEIAGYASQIVDYKPSSLTFNSSLNPDWYISDNKLYTDVLKEDLLEPGETREVKLYLSKKMTESNTGLINNIAEISVDNNAMGVEDINSTPGNKKAEENDQGTADVIISVSTGIAIRVISITLILIVIISSIVYIISKKIFKEI